MNLDKNSNIGSSNITINSKSFKDKKNEVKIAYVRYDVKEEKFIEGYSNAKFDGMTYSLKIDYDYVGIWENELDKEDCIKEEFGYIYSFDKDLKKAWNKIRKYLKENGIINEEREKKKKYLKVMENEKKCIERNMQKQCQNSNRCYGCSLVLVDKDIIETYDYLIDRLKKELEV